MNLIGLTIALVLLVSAGAQAAPPVPFEDVNGNGVFDTGDRDLTADLKPDPKCGTDQNPCWYTSVSSPHSIVIPAGITWLKCPDRYTGFAIASAKTLTVNSSIACPVYAGMVDLRGASVAIGPKVVITGRDYTAVSATQGDLTVGPGASWASSDGSANLGTVMFWALGRIAFAAGVKLTARRDLLINADVVVADRLGATATDILNIAAYRQATITGSVFVGGDVNISTTGPAGTLPMTFTGNRVSARDSCFIDNWSGTLDVAGSLLPKGCTISK